MKMQNRLVTTKAYKIENKSLATAILLATLVVMSMTFYNSAVLIGKTNGETYSHGDF